MPITHKQSSIVKSNKGGCYINLGKKIRTKIKAVNVHVIHFKQIPIMQ